MMTCFPDKQQLVCAAFLLFLTTGVIALAQEWNIESIGVMDGFYRHQPVTNKNTNAFKTVPEWWTQTDFPYTKKPYAQEVIFADAISTPRLLGGERKDNQRLKDLVTRAQDGTLVYHWDRFHEFLDAYVEQGYGLTLVLDNVPYCFPTVPREGVYGQRVAPADFDEWYQFIRALCVELQQRYGHETASQFRFRMGTEAEDTQRFDGTFQEFCQYYDYAAKAIREVLPDAKVGPYNGKAGSVNGWQNGNAGYYPLADHCTNGTNHATGQTGSPFDFMSCSLYYHVKFKTNGTLANVHPGEFIPGIRETWDTTEALLQASDLPREVHEYYTPYETEEGLKGPDTGARGAAQTLDTIIELKKIGTDAIYHWGIVESLDSADASKTLIWSQCWLYLIFERMREGALYSLSPTSKPASGNRINAFLSVKPNEAIVVCANWHIDRTLHPDEDISLGIPADLLAKRIERVRYISFSEQNSVCDILRDDFKEAGLLSAQHLAHRGEPATTATSTYSDRMAADPEIGRQFILQNWDKYKGLMEDSLTLGEFAGEWQSDSIETRINFRAPSPSVTVMVLEYAGGASMEPPTARDDAFSTEKNKSFTVDAAGVLANDSDPIGIPMQAHVTSSPGHGSLELLMDGRFTYIPETDWVGVDSFTYSASNGTQESPPATVTIVVHEERDYATWVDSYTWPEGSDTMFDGIRPGAAVTNGFHYLFNTDPSHGTGPIIRSALFDIDSDRYLTIAYPRAYGSESAHLWVESSTDLVQWTPRFPNGVDVLEETIDPDYGQSGATAWMQTSVKVDPAVSQCFLRLASARNLLSDGSFSTGSFLTNFGITDQTDAGQSWQWSSLCRWEYDADYQWVHLAGTSGDSALVQSLADNRTTTGTGGVTLLATNFEGDAVPNSLQMRLYGVNGDFTWNHADPSGPAGSSLLAELTTGGESHDWQQLETSVHFGSTGYDYLILQILAEGIDPAEGDALAIDSLKLWSYGIATSIQPVTLFFDDFAANPDPGNTSSPIPGIWYLPTGGEGEIGNHPNSTNTTAGGTSDVQMLRLGYASDTVSVRLFLSHAWELTRTVTIHFDWEKIETFSENDTGFDVSIRAVNGNGASLSVLSARDQIGQGTPINTTGKESIRITSDVLNAAGITGTEQIGLWFHKDGSAAPNRYDVYAIDNVRIEQSGW